MLYGEKEEFNARFTPVLSYLQKVAKDKGNVKILDIGCGTGEVAVRYKKFGEVYGIDISPKSIEEAERNNRCDEYFVGMAEDLPFNKSYFDIVICTEVIEHLMDVERACSEINRVLKNTGYLIISTPNPLSYLMIRRKIVEKIKRKHFGQIIENPISSRRLKKLFKMTAFEVEEFKTVYFEPAFFWRVVDKINPAISGIFGLYQIYLAKKLHAKSPLQK